MSDIPAEVLARIEGDTAVLGRLADEPVDLVWGRPDATVAMVVHTTPPAIALEPSVIQRIDPEYLKKHAGQSVEDVALVTSGDIAEHACAVAANIDLTVYGRPVLRDWLAQAALAMEELGPLFEGD